MSSGHRRVPRGHKGVQHLMPAWPSPRPSPWAASFPPQILIYHPAFIKYVFDSWLQGHGRYPSTGILSVIFSLHVCDEVGHTHPPLPRVPQGPSRAPAVRTSIPTPRPLLGAQVLSPLWGLQCLLHRTFQEGVLFSWCGSCPGQGQAQQVAQTWGPNKGADCNGEAVWGFSFHLICLLESSVQLNSSPQATAQPTSTRTAGSGDQGPKGSPRHPGLPLLTKIENQ